MKIALAILTLLASIYAANAFGISKEGAIFSRLGNITGVKKITPATPCSGTGLIFTSACNSQYIGIL